ncbi:MAG: TatD family deoxyribonuclease [Actinobacteria bacterium]|nr:TatD family deoxyribonuclease [Actinomycetota bacterium]
MGSAAGRYGGVEGRDPLPPPRGVRGVRERPPVTAPLPRPVVDTHCHLDVVDRQLGDGPLPDDALALAREAGITRVVQVGCDVASSTWAADFAGARDDVAATVALHPNEVPRIAQREGRAGLDAAYAAIETLAARESVRAVGETGLDYYRTRDVDAQALQHESFRRHIDMAKRLDRTLVIHDRDAHDDILSILDEEGAPSRVVFHCFSGDAAMARFCSDRGWWCSFAGVVTYKNADGLREALRVLPREAILVETDAPYLTPVPHRGAVNASYLIPFTVRAMAELRDESVEQLCDDLWGNAQRAFGPL